MSREAMKLALEAFEAIPEEVEGWIPSKCTDAIIALKQALSQLEPEPVGYQETAEKCRLETVPAKGTLLHTTPPKREWQGLTDEEIDELRDETLREFARAIQAKLKENNT